MDKDTYLKIRRPADQCLMCGANLIEAGKHPSTIQSDGEEGVIRKDYCATCWGRMDEGEEFFSFWIATRQDKPERSRISREERNQLLQAYFEHLARTAKEDPPNARPAHLFLVAHLLMRFRVFRWKRTDRGEDGQIVFENVQTGEEWTVGQMELDDESVARIKQEIEEYLRRGQDIDVVF